MHDRQMALSLQASAGLVLLDREVDVKGEASEAVPGAVGGLGVRGWSTHQRPAHGTHIARVPRCSTGRDRRITAEITDRLTSRVVRG